jgi:acyl phosphate:glycerol-3-phosphate acyltransferase
MNYSIVVLIFIFSFFLGSVPTAFFVVKLITGKDLRKVGSGNIGGTNASRAADNKTQKYLIYIITAVGDILKGLVPVLIAVGVFKNKDIKIDKNLIYTITALLAILGHDTMPFIKKGQGKGVATTFGAFVAIAPIPAYIGFATFFTLRLFTPVASRRSIAGGIIIAIAAILLKYPMSIAIGTVISSVLVVFTHKENIKRIMRGQE